MLAAWGLVLAIALPVAAGAIDAAEPGDLATQLQAATAYHKQADYGHSIPILKQIVKENPHNYMANLLLGVDLLRSGSARDALGPLRAASDARPDDGAAQAYLAEAAIALGEPAMASEAFQSAVARSGGEEQYLTAWANYCLDRFHILEMSFLSTKRGEGTELRVEAWGHPEGSETRETLLEQSAARDPEQQGIWGDLGVAQLELGRSAQAQESLKQAERREPQGAETLQLEALMAAGEGNWQDAEKRLLSLGERSPSELRRVVAIWPAARQPGPEVAGTLWQCLREKGGACNLLSAPPHGGAGLSAKELYAQGRWEQLKALPAVAPADGPGSLWRGVALARTGDCSKAIPSLERGLKADERVAEFWLQVCYGNEESRAEERLSKAGDEVALHQLRGDVALRLRSDAAAAQKEYSEALKSRPNDPRLLANLAEADRMLGDTEHARSAALAALALSPRLSSALRTLAEMAMNERDYAEALARLKELAVVQPKDAWTQVELGVAYGQLGQPSEAVNRLGPQLAAGYPDAKGALHAQLARALRKLGREDEARQAAQEAARLANSTLQNSEQGNSDGRQ
jgi:predicted Zn-dependent protease